MNTTNIIFGFFGWWYSEGIKKLAHFLSALFIAVEGFFSARTVLRTFFAPWKRLVGARRPGIDGLKDWIVDNLISRMVGVIMRSFILILFVLGLAFYLIFSVLAIALWFLFPILILASFVYIFI